MSSAAVTGAVGFVIFAVLHIALPLVIPTIHRGLLTFRLMPAIAVSVAVLVLAGVAMSEKCSDACFARGLMALIWGELTFFGLFVLYMPFLYTLTHSLSVETLVLLSESQGGSVPKAVLEKRYTSDRFLHDRLTAMVEAKYLDPVDSKYALTPRGRALAQGFGSLKRLWHLEPGG